MALLMISVAQAAPSKKPDFYSYNKDGSVKIHGVYKTNAAGEVVKYTVFNGAGKLKYTEIPYYSRDGKIIRADHFSASEKLKFVIVYFAHTSTELDGNGKFLKTIPFSQKEFLSASKH